MRLLDERLHLAAAEVVAERDQLDGAAQARADRYGREMTNATAAVMIAAEPPPIRYVVLTSPGKSDSVRHRCTIRCAVMPGGRACGVDVDPWCSPVTSAIERYAAARLSASSHRASAQRARPVDTAHDAWHQRAPPLMLIVCPLT